MSDIVFRTGNPSDVEKAVEIAIVVYRPIYEYYSKTLGKEMFEDLYPNWRDIKSNQIRRYFLPTENHYVEVVEAEGRMIGFITYFVDPILHVGIIDNNAVHTDMQGKGIGHLMYEHVFEKLIELGMKYVEVTTGGDPSHEPARRAYERAGFAIQIPSVKYYKKL